MHRRFFLTTATALIAAPDAPLKPIPYTSDGRIPFPDYTTWVFVGSGLFSAPPVGPNARFSNVFVDPEAYDEYVKTGAWPDRTVIFSEKRASITTLPITANAGWGQTGDVIGAELEVKDQARGDWTYDIAVQFYPRLVDAAKRHGTYKVATN